MAMELNLILVNEDGGPPANKLSVVQQAGWIMTPVDMDNLNKELPSPFGSTGSVSDIDIDDVSVSIHTSILDIDAAEWDLCVPDDDLTTRHFHLAALEMSGCVSIKTGYQPNHVVLRDKSGCLVAAAPTYIKSNSAAELGADIGWSLAHTRFAGDYYPKLQVEVPFHPVSGGRLLTRAGADSMALRKRLLAELIDLVERLQLSSLHIGFMTREENDLTTSLGMLSGSGTTAIWRNNDLKSFDEFLSLMGSRKRQMIRKERKAVEKYNFEFDYLTGDSLKPYHLKDFFDLYINTYLKYDFEHHLNTKYFEQIANTNAQNLLLILARREQEAVGATLYFVSGNRMIAMHWGFYDKIRFLHFEVTYYRAIEYAIANGLVSIDFIDAAPHKVPRGLLPTSTFHAHYFRNAEFQELVSDGLSKKNDTISADRALLAQSSPFLKERFDWSGLNEH